MTISLIGLLREDIPIAIGMLRARPTPYTLNRSIHYCRRSMSRFRVIEHTIRAQNVRERPGAVLPGYQQDVRLAVKQYVPIDNPSPQDGDVTLIGAHANGFPKVLLSLSKIGINLAK